jgi:hypothetical protein
MKTPDEIRQRIRGLLAQELDRRWATATRRLPQLCTFNIRHALDLRKMVEGEENEFFNRITSKRHLPVTQSIGLCGYGQENPEEWQGTICEDPIDAQRCPLFVPKKSQDEILVEFQEQLAEEGWLEEHMPEVSALLWALEDADTNFVKVPWWKVIWHRWFLRVRIEPVVNVPDPSRLLEAPKETPKDESVSS